MKNHRSVVVVLFLLSVVILGGFYYVNFDEKVGTGDAPYCEIAVFEDLDDLGRQRYDGSDINISESIEIGSGDTNQLEQDLVVKQEICASASSNLSKAGNIREKLKLNISSSGGDYYRNEADEIVYIDAGIAT